MLAVGALVSTLGAAHADDGNEGRLRHPFEATRVSAPITAVGFYLRGDEARARAQMARVNSLSPSVVVEPTHAAAREFENGNTHVRLPVEVLGRRVSVHVPNVVTPNQLMEALLVVRAARSGGAREIHVATEVTLEKIEVRGLAGALAVPVEMLFQVAGATRSEVAGWPYRVLERDSPLPSPGVATGGGFVYGDSHSELSQSLAQELRLPVLPSLNMEGAFAREGLRGERVFFVAPAVAPVNESLFARLNECLRLARAGADVHWITPYLPYARSDKADGPGTPIAGRLVADWIEAAGARWVTFVRAHAPQSEGFFSIPVFHVSSRELINRHLQAVGAQLIVAPDAGMQKEATLHADALRLPIVVANKQRDTDGRSRLVGLAGDALNGIVGKTAAIVDDEVASGGTLAAVARLLKERGAARVIAVVTHLAGSARAALESPDIDQITVSNTFPMPTSVASPKVVTLDVGPEIAARLAPLAKFRARRPDACDADAAAEPLGQDDSD